MEEHVPVVKFPEHLKRFHKNKKPFWNAELNNLFIHMVDAEKCFTKCKVRFHKRDLVLNINKLEICLIKPIDV